MMQVESGHPAVWQFKRSIVKIVAASVVLAVVFGLSLWLTGFLLANTSGSVWLWALPAFVGILLAISLANLLLLPKIVYQLTDRGITLHNISSTEILWRNVASVSRMSSKGSQMVALQLAPNFTLKRFNLIPQNRIAINAAIVTSKFDELLRVIREAHSNFHDGADPAS